VVNGMLRTVFGMSDIVQFRFVALGFSFAALFFVYALLTTYWSRRTAQLALALWVINPIWLQHADYLHHEPYAAFFGFGSVFFLTRYLRDEQRRAFLVASGTFLFFTFLASYDYWFFAPLLLAMVAVGHYGVRPAAVRVLSILASCAAAALICKWSTNAWALGGVGAFVHDLRYQLIERATNQAVKVRYAAGIWPTLYGRVERSFSLLLFPITAFWAALPFVRRRWANRLPRLDHAVNPMLLLLAALPFLCIFTELWVGQYYPTLLVVPFYAVACAAVASLLLDSSRRLVKAAGATLVVALMVNSVDADVRFKKAF